MRTIFLPPVSALLLHLGGHVRGVLAQTTGSSSTAFAPSGVPLETRTTWCQAQTDTCGTLCGGKTKENSCDPDSLTYTCTCVSGIIPSLSNYQSTIPYFICQQTFIDCTTANPGDTAQCASTCGTARPSAIPGANVANTTANASRTSKTSATTKSSGTGAAATATHSAGGSSGRGVSMGAVAGIAIGGAAVAIVGTTAVIWLVSRWKYGKGKRKRERESEVFGRNGCERYKELDAVRGHPGAFGKFEKDGVVGQIHEMGMVGGRERPPRPPRPDAELDSGSLDWVELPSEG